MQNDLHTFVGYELYRHYREALTCEEARHCTLLLCFFLLCMNRCSCLTCVTWTNVCKCSHWWNVLIMLESVDVKYSAAPSAPSCCTSNSGVYTGPPTQTDMKCLGWSYECSLLYLYLIILWAMLVAPPPPHFGWKITVAPTRSSSSSCGYAPQVQSRVIIVD